MHHINEVHLQHSHIKPTYNMQERQDSKNTCCEDGFLPSIHRASVTQMLPQVSVSNQNTVRVQGQLVQSLLLFLAASHILTRFLSD